MAGSTVDDAAAHVHTPITATTISAQDVFVMFYSNSNDCKHALQLAQRVDAGISLEAPRRPRWSLAIHATRAIHRTRRVPPNPKSSFCCQLAHGPQSG